MYENLYSAPQKWALIIVGTLEEGLSYEFNMFVVWKNMRGEFFYAGDSGCSCPSPFEDYTSISDLTKATKHEVIHAASFWGAAHEVDASRLIEKLITL